jgi:hypothetical protein
MELIGLVFLSTLEIQELGHQLLKDGMESLNFKFKMKKRQAKKLKDNSKKIKISKYLNKIKI